MYKFVRWVSERKAKVLLVVGIVLVAVGVLLPFVSFRSVVRSAGPATEHTTYYSTKPRCTLLKGRVPKLVLAVTIFQRPKATMMISESASLGIEGALRLPELPKSPGP